MRLDFSEYLAQINEAKESGAEYVVIFEVHDHVYSEPYAGKEAAFNRQKKLSSIGLWSVSIELRDEHVLAYIQGYLFKK